MPSYSSLMQVVKEQAEQHFPSARRNWHRPRPVTPETESLVSQMEALQIHEQNTQPQTPLHEYNPHGLPPGIPTFLGHCNPRHQEQQSAARTDLIQTIDELYSLQIRYNQFFNLSQRKDLGVYPKWLPEDTHRLLALQNWRLTLEDLNRWPFDPQADENLPHFLNGPTLVTTAPDLQDSEAPNADGHRSVPMSQPAPLNSTNVHMLASITPKMGEHTLHSKVASNSTVHSWLDRVEPPSSSSLDTSWSHESFLESTWLSQDFTPARSGFESRSSGLNRAPLVQPLYDGALSGRSQSSRPNTTSHVLQPPHYYAPRDIQKELTAAKLETDRIEFASHGSWVAVERQEQPFLFSRREMGASKESDTPVSDPFPIRRVYRYA